MKIYFDTSIYGGYYDKGFEDSTRLFHWVNQNNIKVMVSNIVIQELTKAHEKTRLRLLETLVLIKNIEISAFTEEMEVLAKEYLVLGILQEKSIEDARHIAFATIEGIADIISWNFKHMVSRNSQYNIVNLQNGRKEINIYTPEHYLRLKK